MTNKFITGVGLAIGFLVLGLSLRFCHRNNKCAVNDK